MATTRPMPKIAFDAPWPQSFSQATRLLNALIFLPNNDASGETVVIGSLPDGVGARTLSPFLEESFRDASNARIGITHSRMNVFYELFIFIFQTNVYHACSLYLVFDPSSSSS